MKNEQYACRLFLLYGEEITRFEKLIYLPMIPTKDQLFIWKNKNFKIKYVAIRYEDETKEVIVDLYISQNKDQKIDNILEQKSKLFPTHLINEDRLNE